MGPLDPPGGPGHHGERVGRHEGTTAGGPACKRQPMAAGELPAHARPLPWRAQVLEKIKATIDSGSFYEVRTNACTSACTNHAVVASSERWASLPHLSTRAALPWAQDWPAPSKPAGKLAGGWRAAGRGQPASPSPELRQRHTGLGRRPAAPSRRPGKPWAPGSQQARPPVRACGGVARRRPGRRASLPPPLGPFVATAHGPGQVPSSALQTPW